MDEHSIGHAEERHDADHECTLQLGDDQTGQIRSAEGVTSLPKEYADGFDRPPRRDTWCCTAVRARPQQGAWTCA
jgi:hypothetical protein